MSLWIDWQIDASMEEQEKMNVLFEKAVAAALDAEGVKTAVEVSLSVVSENVIRETNRDFRQIDKVTDVLSFPLIEYYDMTPAEGVARGDIDPDTGEVCLGDVIICYQRAIEQADEFGHSLERELGFLTVHSILHLLGYDHMEPDEEKVMTEKQKAILEGIGLRR